MTSTNLAIAESPLLGHRVVRRQVPKMLAVQVQQVECEEHTFAATEQQVIEDRKARVIDAGDFEDVVIGVERFRSA